MFSSGMIIYFLILLILLIKPRIFNISIASSSSSFFDVHDPTCCKQQKELMF